MVMVGELLFNHVEWCGGCGGGVGEVYSFFSFIVWVGMVFGGGGWVRER